MYSDVDELFMPAVAQFVPALAGQEV